MTIKKNPFTANLISTGHERARRTLRLRVDRPVATPSLPNLPDLWPALADETQFVRSQYRNLYESPVIENADGSRSFHDARLYRCHGLNVLFLRGDCVEMAFQHGRLLADEIPSGTLDGAARLIENTLANTWGSPGKVRQWLFEKAQQYATRRTLDFARGRIRKALPQATMFAGLAALSDAAGIPPERLLRALFNPEILLVLARLGGVACPTCCSSFAAWGSYTSDGNLLIGRNMDYPLNGYYDSFPTVIYYEPTDSGLRHMSFVSAGVHSAGITSYNEAGLFLASHVVPSRDVSLRGVPMFLTADLAASRGTSFDSAARLFRELPCQGGWSYLMASTKEQRVGSLEKTPRHFAQRPSQGECHVQTNRFQTPELSSQHFSLNASVDEDSDARAWRIRQRLETARGRLDAAEFLSILSDQVDPILNQPRGLGNTIGMHATLTSVVLDPARGRALVSSGRGPACHGDFVELPLVGTFDRQDFPLLTCPVTRNTGFPSAHPEKYRAQQIFIRAKMAYEYDNDAVRAYELLQEVVQWDSSNPAYYFQLAIFALKNKDYSEALEDLDDVLHSTHVTEQLRRLAYYYRGRTYAHLGKRREALADLAAVQSDALADARPRAAARRAAWTTKLFGRCRLRERSLKIMMQQSDMLQY